MKSLKLGMININSPNKSN